MKDILRSLDRHERKVFLLHSTYSLIEGIILGILALNEYVLIKSLKGTEMQIGLLFQFGSVVLLFGVVMNEWIRRSSNKVKLLRRLAWITRLPLLAIAFFPQTLGDPTRQFYIGTAFLLIFLLFYFANPIIYPIINLLLKSNYRHEHFGPLYSYATGLNKLVMLGATFLFGFWLDKDPFAFRWVYPGMAVLAILSIYMLSLIPLREDAAEPRTSAGLITSVRDSLRNMTSILKNNKPFRDFETGFNLYGFAWMTTVAVITIYFDKELKLSYSSVAFYKNAYNLLSIILFPFFGKLIGKIDPRKFGIYTFLSLFFHFLFLLLTRYFPANQTIAGIQLYYLLIPAYLFNAVFAATMGLLWYIGSAYFSPKEETADYQSVHLTMTGIRALYGPILGVLFYKWFGTALTFIFAMAALLLAVWVMNRSMHKYPAGQP